MKPYLSDQIIVALAGITGLCVIIFLGFGFSPTFAAVLSRGADLSIALAVRRSVIYPLCAIKCRLPPLGACARWSIDRIVSLF